MLHVLSIHKLISESILHCRRMKNKISFWTRFMNSTPQHIIFVNSYLWFTTLVKIYSVYCMQYNLWHKLGLSCHRKALNTRAGLVHWLQAAVLLVSKTVSCLEQHDLNAGLLCLHENSSRALCVIEHHGLLARYITSQTRTATPLEYAITAIHRMLLA